MAYLIKCPFYFLSCVTPHGNHLIVYAITLNLKPVISLISIFTSSIPLCFRKILFRDKRFRLKMFTTVLFLIDFIDFKHFLKLNAIIRYIIMWLIQFLNDKHNVVRCDFRLSYILTKGWNIIYPCWIHVKYPWDKSPKIISWPCWNWF